ncbi:MAG: rhamnan synthesis F family protein [Selenomonadaceae bacterium]|nr:rhamnan synthesis F family protein [Selenomonadaceae bacterium]
MNLYRTVRSFIGRNIVWPFEDFCAVHRPEIYEFIFYNIRHTTRSEDWGDVLFMHTVGMEDFIKLKREQDFVLRIPLNFPVVPKKLRVAAIIHVFYPELAKQIKTFLQNIPCAVDVFISTTSDEKRIATEKIFGDFDKGSVTIRVFPNRGRDLAAAVVGFRDIYDNYDFCVHLHTKKSPHAATVLAGWREQLYRNLLGSPEIVGSIFEILSHDNVGLVFPQYFPPVRVSINWGENYLNTKTFMNKLGINIDTHNLVEFPAGSMFWFKPKALAPLLDMGLTFDDFPEERGQIDGTLAHAIERSFLFVVESAGFDWVKVTGDEKFFNITPVLKSYSQEELTENIAKTRHSVLKTYKKIV